MAKTIASVCIVPMIIVLSGGCAALPETSGYTIPEQFRGHWSAEPQICGSGLDVQSVHITHDQFIQYEGAGQVRLVRSIGPRAVAFNARMLHGEDHWPLNVEARLVNPGLMRLTIDSDEFEFNGLDLHRCEPTRLP